MAQPPNNRIICPRCRANNFPGQPRCFQCGSSLPPPEDIGKAANLAQAPSPVPPNPYQYPVSGQNQPQLARPANYPGPGKNPVQFTPQHPKARGGGSHRLLVAGIAGTCVLVIGALLLSGARKAGIGANTRGASAESQVSELDQLRKKHGLERTSGGTTSGDDGTRAELSRLRQKYGIGTGTPHNPNDGSIPNGGAITFDDWRRSHPDGTNYQFR